MARIRVYDITVSIPSSPWNLDMPDILHVSRRFSFDLDRAVVSGSIDTTLLTEFQIAVNELRKAMAVIGKDA